MELIYDALSFDSGARKSFCSTFSYVHSLHTRLSAVELILKRARGIEAATYEHFEGATANYKAKIRSLFVNLKDKNNPYLRENVVSGEIPVEKLPTMSSGVKSFFYFLHLPC